MTASSLPFSLNTVRHDVFFQAPKFNPRRVALVGSPDMVGELLEILARLGIQNFSIFSEGDLTARISHVRRAVELPGEHQLNVLVSPLKARAILAQAPFEVCFILHRERQLNAVMSRLLLKPGFARALFTFDISDFQMRILGIETHDIENENVLVPMGDSGSLNIFPCGQSVVASLLANSFLAWWGHHGSRKGPSPLLWKFKKETKSSVLPFFQHCRQGVSEILSTPIDVVGLGAVGSWAVINLLNVGFTQVRGYDFDRVDAHNVPNQAFYQSQACQSGDQGQYKALALAEVCQDLGLKTFTPHVVKVDVETHEFAPIVVLATDDMAGRARFFRRSDPGAMEMVIDARIGVVTPTAEVSLCWMRHEEEREGYAVSLQGLANDQANRPRIRDVGCHNPTLATSSYACGALVATQILAAFCGPASHFGDKPPRWDYLFFETVLRSLGQSTRGS